MSDKNESTEAQNKLMEEFEKISTRLRSETSLTPIRDSKAVQKLANSVLSTYQTVELMHTNARIKEAEARIAEARNHSSVGQQPK